MMVLYSAIASNTLIWSNGGQMVVKWWSNGGQMVVKWWSNGGQMVVKWWSNGGQMMTSHYKHNQSIMFQPIFFLYFIYFGS